MKRSVETPVSTEPSNKRGAAAQSVDREASSATSLQAAWRGFCVRSSGLAAQSREHTKSSQSAEVARRSGNISSRLRTPEYRQVGAVLLPAPHCTAGRTLASNNGDAMTRRCARETRRATQ
eukprot:4002019-Prymnesium_polylepis.1